MSGFPRTATRDVPGTISLRICRCLPLNSERSRNSPVMLPPGRAMLATSAASTGIDFEVYPHDRNRRRRVLSGCQCPGAAGENHINFEPCEVERELWENFRLVVRGSVLEGDVPSLHVSCLA